MGLLKNPYLLKYKNIKYKSKYLGDYLITTGNITTAGIATRRLQLLVR